MKRVAKLISAVIMIKLPVEVKAEFWKYDIIFYSCRL